ncbi:hypothetical protein GGR57DRAFT_508223 [Xylariaceae sp. FL1272]|nr:hypothetical protein GGR57DRAFT_508223 [Xylariaceae sp. FL1272]
MSNIENELVVSDAEGPILLLRSLEDEIPDVEIPIFRMFAATLQYPTDSQTRAVKLASDINFVCQAEAAGERIGDVIMYIWMQLIQIAHCVPPDHMWVECLVQTIEILRGQYGIVPGMGSAGLWANLPYFAQAMREKMDEYSPVIHPNATVSNRYLAGWKTLNTFAIKLTTNPIQWFGLALHSVRWALEEPLAKADIQSCRLWVACKWLIAHTDGMHDYMVARQGDEGTTMDPSLRPGELCGDSVSSLGDDRWEHWEKRLQAQKNDSEGLGIDEETGRLMEEAIEKVNAALRRKS